MTFALTPRDRRIHVFSVSDGTVKLAHQTYLSRLASEPEGNSLADAVGAEIDPTYAEVFSVHDVEPMGLRAYLAQAHDIPDATLAADAARLDALSGDVVVLAPGAVEGVEELHPRPELTHIGSYAPAEVDDSPRELPKAAHTPSAAAEPPRATGRPMANRTIVLVVVAALVIAALLFLL
ncbi:hypothetical protein [Jannaschia rubra]|uniref:Uncharacterized protein n=1 Tax=Jannaschia rubra TaxID=282197 RepID=A0A0M6XUR4_9RHOB|nr:hypothetical protein [Jannaschia rubra]CTQ33694.1 hypothetical protein JAN5088_02479 [Jannaschia rubra]SFG06757.1 hypothetical protein SAMN04488517_102527 [Jannaschia rubra]